MQLRQQKVYLGFCMSSAQSRPCFIKGRDCLRGQGRGILVPAEGLSGGVCDFLGCRDTHNHQATSCRQRSL